MKKEITVQVTSVLEARALAELVAKANLFSSKIMLHMDERSVNAKSIMGIMGLGMDMGRKIVIDAEGEDEAEAIKALEEFLTKS